MEDAGIIDLYWARNQRAIYETRVKYGPYLKRVAVNVLSDDEDAEECVNDTYLGAWNAMPPTRPAVLRVFLGKIARRISLNRMRERLAYKRGGGEAALVLEELQECIPDGSDTEKTVEAKLLGRALDHFLETVPERQRAIFVRRYWHMEPIHEIAKAAGMTEGAVKTSLHRTREKLRDFLRKEGWL